MDVPQHTMLAVDRFIVLAAAVKQKIVVLWATWDGGATRYQIIDLRSRVEGPLIIHGYSGYLCAFYTFEQKTVDIADDNLLSSRPQDSALPQDKEGLDSSQAMEENIGAIVIDLVLLICGNYWEDVCFESQLRCVDGLASIRALASCAEQLFLLTTQSIIQCSIVSIGSKRRLVVQSIHSHFLHSVLSTQRSELGVSNSIRMAVHVEEIGDVLVAIYGPFLYIQRLSEGSITLYYDSAKDNNWQETVIKYKRLTILKVERFYNHRLKNQNSKGPIYYYLIVGSTGVLLYMTWSTMGTTFIPLLEVPLTTRSEYTGCVRCADNFLLLNHRQQKVFCAKRVTLESEALHNVPAFVDAPTALPGILNSKSIIFRLDSIDFDPCSFPLSILISYNGDGITCHCIDPASDAASQQLHSFLPMYKSFLLHSNKDYGPVYELEADPHPKQRLGQPIAISFSKYHLFRRLEFYWDTSLDGTLRSILPIVVNYHKEDTKLVEKRLHLPILPLNIIGNARKNHEASANLREKLATRLSASSCIYDDYLITIHSSTEAHEFASPLLRRWLYSYPTSDLAPLFAAAYYLLTTNLRTGKQHWLPLPFHLPHLRFEIASVHFAESDYMDKRVPELSIVLYSFAMHLESSLLCRCIFKEGRSSLLTDNLNSLLLLVTKLNDLLNKCRPGPLFQVIHAGSNSSYALAVSDCCIIELYHDLSDGGASYEEIRPLQYKLRGAVYKQLCTSLVCQLGGDYERTLTPAELGPSIEQDNSTSNRSTQAHVTLGENPNQRIPILNGMCGQRFYCIVFIGEKGMFGPSIPSLSVDRSLAMKHFPEEELKWYQFVSKLDDETPLALGLMLLSHNSRKAVRIFEFPILAHLQKDVPSFDKEVSIYDYLDMITVSLAQREAYVGLVNLSTTNTMNDWVLVCVLERHICVYSVPLGTILALEQASEHLGPLLGVQGFAWLKGAAIYIHGQNSSQLVTLMQTHGTINDCERRV